MVKFHIKSSALENMGDAHGNREPNFKMAPFRNKDFEVQAEIVVLFPHFFTR